MSIKSVTEVIVALQKPFYFGCVYVLTSEEEIISGNKLFGHPFPVVVVL
jgi:hypothetical protein